MAGEKERKRTKGWLRRGIHSLRMQVSLIVLLSYLFPVALLGFFTGSILLGTLERKTEAAVTSSAQHAFAMTEQNISRTVDLARDATYDGELTAAWEKWSSGAAGDAEFLKLCRGYLERKYSREPLFSYAGCFPVSKPEILISNRTGTSDSPAYLQDLQQAVTELGETLDTRCCFFSFGGRMYLIRNLLNLKMERYGMLILGVDQGKLLEPLNRLKNDWNAEVEIRLDLYSDAAESWETLNPGLTDDRKAGQLQYVRLARGEENTPDLKLTMDRRQQYREVYEFRRLLTGVYLLLIPILILLTVYLRKRIIKPIALLSDASRRIESGELGVTVPMRGSDEL